VLKNAGLCSVRQAFDLLSSKPVNFSEVILKKLLFLANVSRDLLSSKPVNLIFLDHTIFKLLECIKPKIQVCL
jgi:hypothetical protein